MPCIFSYYDYRQFLREYLHELKERNPFFSYRYVGGKVGMDASYVLKVIQGLLHLSEKKIPSFAAFCKLNEREAEYFRLMVLFNKARTVEEGRVYFERMMDINERPAMKLERDQYLFFTKWYYSAVWCALNEFRCKKNFAELGGHLRPAISAAEAKEAVQLLERLRLIQRDAEGIFINSQENISTGKAWHSMAVQQYQKEMIRLGEESLERFPKAERDISTLTLNVGKEVLEELRSVTEEYRRTVARLSNRSEGTDRVYQLNIQLFPLTAPVEKTV